MKSSDLEKQVDNTDNLPKVDRVFLPDGIGQQHLTMPTIGAHEIPIVMAASSMIPFQGPMPAVTGTLGGIGALRLLQKLDKYKKAGPAGKFLSGVGAAATGVVGGGALWELLKNRMT